MRLQYIISIIIFFPLLLIQTTVIPLIAINGIVPDLILILLVFYSLRFGQVYGTILGFVFGFLFDLITGSLLGSTMFSKTLAGFIAGYFYNEKNPDIYKKSVFFSLIVLLCAIIDSVVYSFFTNINFNSNFLTLIFDQGMLPGFYTAVFSLIVIIFYPRSRFS
ncbi:MAG: rod shape-determining protein MreD [Ignavibacteriaceae bacterium]